MLELSRCEPPDHYVHAHLLAERRGRGTRDSGTASATYRCRRRRRRRRQRTCRFQGNRYVGVRDFRLEVGLYINKLENPIDRKASHKKLSTLANRVISSDVREKSSILMAKNTVVLLLLYPKIQQRW
jgi:hypothetical protein